MISNDFAFFVQARMGSKRLPHKVLLPFFESKSILNLITDRLITNFPNIPIVICTSNSIEDDLIELFCNEKKISCFRGSEQNVLSRFVEASQFYNFKYLVRVCADNPFLDVSFINKLLNIHHQNSKADYWSFKNINSVPVIKTHFGFFTEIVTLMALEKVLEKTSDPLYLEHVTNFIYSNSDFVSFLEFLPDNLIKRDDLRFTIDDESDFQNLALVYEFYNKNECDIFKTIVFVDSQPKIKNVMMYNINKYSK